MIRSQEVGLVARGGSCAHSTTPTFSWASTAREEKVKEIEVGQGVPQMREERSNYS